MITKKKQKLAVIKPPKEIVEKYDEMRKRAEKSRGMWYEGCLSD
jgi:hypothetical protein